MSSISSVVSPTILSSEEDPKKSPSFIKKFFRGFGIGLAQIPFSGASVFLALKAGIIPPLAGMRVVLFKEQSSQIEQSQLEEPAAIDPEKAWMRFEMQQAQLEMERDRQRIIERVVLIWTVGIAPIVEELFFRGLIQDVFLKRIPQRILKRVSPEKTWVLDSRISQVARIVFTSALFSAFHLTNKEIFSDDYVNMQLVKTFAMGLVFGAVQESKLGLVGAIGAHMANNSVAVLASLLERRLKV